MLISLNNVKEIKAGVGYTVGNMLIKGASFLTLPIFSRLLSPNQYGVYTTYLAYESILTVVLGLGIYASIKNAKYDYPGQMDLFFSSLLRISGYAVIVAFGIVALFGYLISQVTTLSKPLLYILVGQSFGTVLLGLYNARISLDYNYKSYIGAACFNTFGSIIFSVVLIIYVFPIQRELGRIIGCAAPLIILSVYIFYEQGLKTKFHADRNMMKYALMIGLPLVWHLLSQTIESQIDRIMITNYIGTAESGIYGFIYNIAVIFQIIFNSTETVWSVWFYEKMDKEEIGKIRDSTKKYIILITYVAVSMLFVSKELIMAMSEQSYWIGTRTFIPILLGLYFLFLYTIPVAIEYYYKKTKYIASATLVAAVVNIVANLIFVPNYGYIAAAYTTLFSYFITFGIHLFVSNKILKLKNKDKIFGVSYFNKGILLTVGAGVITYVANDIWYVRYSCFLILTVFLLIKYNNDIKNVIHSLVKKRSKK